MAVGLYIHVPFCLRKCRYCDFYSVAKPLTEEYVRAVAAGIRAYGNVRFDTVYFGGGTPSLLSPGQVSEILSAADICGGAEISMECNPGSAQGDYFSELRQAGVNRLSFGIQSFADSELKKLGRIHTARQAKDAVNSAAGSGFENISADLMLGIPGQGLESLEESISALGRLPVSHVSAYMLKIEAGTPLSKDKELLQLIPDDDVTADMYLLAAERLTELGFKQYEISNFSRPDFRCRHNLKYWRCEEYIGIGPAAHSYYNGRRFETPGDLKKFLYDPTGFTESENNESGYIPGGLHERLMLMLRLSDGFPLDMAGEAAGRLSAAAMPLERAGLLRNAGGCISLTARGFLVSNEIILRLLEAID